MKFSEALKLMKAGQKVKLPTWGGYWFWDPNKETIIIHTKDGEELDIRETQVVEYTTLNIASEDWMLADEENCPQLGGVATFGFEDAIRMLKRGLKVARQNWNGKDQYVFKIDPYLNDQFRIDEFPTMVGTPYPYLAIKTNYNGLVPWLASQTDMLADDWYIVE